MVRNLLAITRIDAGGLELRRDWVDLREIADRVANAARRRGAAQTITVDLPPDLPLVRADALLIEQTFGNIIANAVAYTPRDARIVIDCVTTPAEIALRITDDGSGIAPEALAHVFEKFVRARNDSRSDGGEGTGLGLAIAKGIMEAHGGAILAESPIADGHGTRIICKFPITEPST
jgi:two-component system sensor histidine kinase KdpD